MKPAVHRSFRHNLCLKVEVDSRKADFFSVTFNISTGGFLLVTNKNIEVGKIYNFEMEIEGIKFHEKAKAVWEQIEDDGSLAYGMQLGAATL
jgi:hypothetical protein